MVEGLRLPAPAIADGHRPARTMRRWPGLLVVAVLLAGVGAVRAQRAPLPAKLCPVSLILDARGRLYDGSTGDAQRRSLPVLAQMLGAGCYPEGGPSPVSAVTVRVAKQADPKRVDALFAVLARAGWPRNRVTVLAWDGATPARH